MLPGFRSLAKPHQKRPKTSSEATQSIIGTDPKYHRMAEIR